MLETVRPSFAVRVGTTLACVSLVTACGSFGSTSTDGPGDADAVDGTRRGDAASLGDASDAPVEDAEAGACGGEAACPRFVFVTSDLYTSEDLGASIGADGKCTLRAALAGTLPALANRTYKAWVSDANASTSASARLTHGTMPYRLANGTPVANDWRQLTSGTLLHAINLDERGTEVGQDFVWTGTTGFGQSTGSTCMNWSLNGAGNTGTVGGASAADNSSWTIAGTAPCGEGHRLYCIEQ